MPIFILFFWPFHFFMRDAKIRYPSHGKETEESTSDDKFEQKRAKVDLPPLR